MRFPRLHYSVDYIFLSFVFTHTNSGILEKKVLIADFFSVRTRSD